jgi:hypothetical protein
MRTLKDIIDPAFAQVFQWSDAVVEDPSAGKLLEDRITHRFILDVVRLYRPATVMNLISDEGRLERYLAENEQSIRQLNLLTLTGNFEQAARQIVGSIGPDIQGRINITIDPDSIAPGSQNLIVMNSIWACLGCEENHDNLGRAAVYNATRLAPEGRMVVVRPNPEAGTLTTYKCLTPDLQSGKDYEFMIKGLEFLPPMKNLHTPNEFVYEHLERAGFEVGATIPLADRDMDGNKTGKVAFLANICKLAL